MPQVEQISAATDAETWLSHFTKHNLPSKADLVLRSSLQSLTGQHRHYEVTWQGIVVEDAFLSMHVTTSGELIRISMRIPDVSEWPSPASFSIDPQQLIPILTKQTGAIDIRHKPVWATTPGGIRSAYRFRVFTNQTQPSWDIWMDASSGKELYRRDRAVYIRHIEEDTTGMARVFHPNPCTAANVEYGDLFVDNMDAHQAVFDELMDTVQLRDIFWDADSQVFRLKGPYVSVQAKSGNSMAPVTSTDGNFYFRRDSSGFEDVMVYYHIDRYQRYVQLLGFTNLQNGPIVADPHGFTSDISAFVPNSGNSYLLFGTGNVDDAEDADVIIHEYIHALSYAAAPETNAGRERRGLDEGLGDYFAAAYSYDITPNQWEKIFNWDGHNEFWNGRMANVSETYPPANSLSIYAYGQIWASALMKMRFEIGDSTMDRLAMESMYYFEAGMEFPQAGRVLITVDSLLYNGDHRETIRKYLCAHRIDSDPLMPCLVVNAQEWEDQLDLSVYPNPSNGLLRITWNPLPAQFFQFDLLNTAGQQVWQAGPMHTGKLDVALSLPAGLYLLRGRNEAGKSISRKIVME